MREEQSPAGPGKTRHYTTYPFPLQEASAGGLQSVFLHESRRAEKDLHILSNDAGAEVFGAAQMHHARPEDPALVGEKFKTWFGTGHWQLLHPDAHTTRAASSEALKAMYDEGYLERLAHADRPLGAGEFGSVELMLRYLEHFMPPLNAHREFNKNYAEELRAIPPESVVNWQDYFFEPAMNHFAGELRAKKCFQTFHLHTTLPDSLNLSTWGRSLLSAMSKMDVVYLHTDTYIERLELQLEALGLNIPTLRRFDLGINKSSIEDSLNKVTPGNFMDHPAYDGLTEAQKRLVDENMRTRGRVPHRFICLDRVDPGKGIDVVVSAAEKLLAEETAHKGKKHVLERYRVFFLADMYNPEGTEDSIDRSSMKECYALNVSQGLRNLEKRFPGVVFVSDGFSGEARDFVASLTRDCHGMTGGAQDGLNLAAQEVLWANKDLPRISLIGSGAGFAIRLEELKIQSGAAIVERGNVDAWRDAFRNLCRLYDAYPELLAAARDATLQVIEKRKDSVIVDH